MIDFFNNDLIFKWSAYVCQTTSTVHILSTFWLLLLIFGYCFCCQAANYIYIYTDTTYRIDAFSPILNNTSCNSFVNMHSSTILNAIWYINVAVNVWILTLLFFLLPVMCQYINTLCPQSGFKPWQFI